MRFSTKTSWVRWACRSTGSRLARYFGTTAEFWVNLQTQYDLRQAEKSLRQIVAKIAPLELAA